MRKRLTRRITSEDSMKALTGMMKEELGGLVRWPFFVLRNGEPYPAKDALEWARWMEEAGRDRVLLQTMVQRKYAVSTVFLGLDHNWRPSGRPVLWETAIFVRPRDEGGRERSDVLDRYDSEPAAVRGHNRLVRKIYANKMPGYPVKQLTARKKS